MGLSGLEPPTSRLSGVRSNQLSYRPIFIMERVKGIEPSSSAWKAEVLPLNYTRIYMEEVEGFEPPRGLTRLSVFKTDPFSRTWVYLRIKIFRWTLQDSNLRPIGYEPIALTN